MDTIKMWLNNEWWYLYSGQYKYEGIVYEIEFYARNKKEAKARIVEMKKMMSYSGQIVAQKDIPDINNN